MATSVKLEYASQRKIRARNKLYYRVLHWPIWIAVFFLIPGPVTFQLFAHGVSAGMLAWLALVLIGTGILGYQGKLPGVEPQPYIIRFTEDRPNPVYRRVCYTLAWSQLIAYTSVNMVGLIGALATGRWQLQQIYREIYFPIVIAVWIAGAVGRLPRVKASTQGEGDERRYFYATVWAVLMAQPALWILWRTLPRGPWSDAAKLCVYTGILAAMGYFAYLGVLPRTRKIVPGELAVSD